MRGKYVALFDTWVVATLVALAIVPAVVANVPEVGNVTPVVLVNVNVAAKAPAVVNAPAVVSAPPNDKANDAHIGAVLDADNSGKLAVAVPAKIAPAEAVE